MLPFGVRSVRYVELVSVEMKLADLGMTHVAEPQPITDICACPHFAETSAGSGQLSDQRSKARITRIAAGELPKATHRDLGRLVPINIELSGSGVQDGRSVGWRAAIIPV